MEGEGQVACKAKQELAMTTNQIYVPLDGSKQIELWLTLTERDWFQPQMYYVAVMDCEDELHMLLGDDRHGRIEVSLHMQDEDSELPYELHGMIKVDIFLLIVFIGLLALNYHSWSNFVKEHEIWNSPHLMCLLAMVV